MSNGNRSSRKPAKAFAIIKSPGKDSAYDVQYIEVGPVWQTKTGGLMTMYNQQGPG